MRVVHVLAYGVALDINASAYGIGGVLFEVVDGTEKVIVSYVKNGLPAGLNDCKVMTSVLCTGEAGSIICILSTKT